MRTVFIGIGNDTRKIGNNDLLSGSDMGDGNLSIGAIIQGVRIAKVIRKIYASIRHIRSELLHSIDRSRISGTDY